MDILFTVEFFTLAKIDWNFVFSGIFQTVILTVVAFVVSVLLVSHLRYEKLTLEAMEGGESRMDAFEAFKIRIANFLGGLHRQPDPFSLLLFTLDEMEQLQEEFDEDEIAQMIAFVEGEVRGALRRDDALMIYDQVKLGLVARIEREHLQSLLERLNRTAAVEAYRTREGKLKKLHLKIGAATFPENGLDVDSLLAAAEAAREAISPEDEQAWKISDVIVIREEEPAASKQDDEDEDEEDEEEEAAAAQARIVDELTGVLGEHYSGAATQKYIAKYRKDEHPVSLMYIDVDGLDQYNSHYGEKAGDEILRTLGGILEVVVREEDIIGRVGGEEFVICMPTPPSDALLAARRVAAEVKKKTVTYAGNKLRFTVCIGVAGFPDHGGVARSLFERAMIAMHAAKYRGRSMVEIYDASMRSNRVREQARVGPTDAF